MSSDLCTFYFSTVDESLKLANIRKKIVKIFDKNNEPITNISAGKLRDKQYGRDFFIEVNARDMTKSLVDSLQLLNQLPRENHPYANYYHDQAGESSFHIVDVNQLVDFDDANAMKYHFERCPYDTPELRFYKAHKDDSEKLLIRINFSAKKLKENLLLKLQSYIDNPSDENYQILKALFDERSLAKKPDFPNSISYPTIKCLSQPGKSGEDLFRSLCFCEFEGDYLFLGFNGEQEVNYSARQTTGGEGFYWKGDYIDSTVKLFQTPALNIIEFIDSCKGVKQVLGKIYSSTEEETAQWNIWKHDAYLCTGGAEGTKKHANIW